VGPIVSSVEIDRSPDEVFAYVTDPSRFAEWQANVVSGHLDGGGFQRVGSRCITARRTGRGERTTISETTEFIPPRSWGVHGTDGRIREDRRVTIEPLSGSARSRLTFELDFEGHGIGKLLVPLVVRRQARRDALINGRTLKERLESDD